MKKIAHILFFILVSSNLYADVILNETFSSLSTPTGWTNTTIQGSYNWSFENSPVFNSPSDNGYAVFNDLAIGSAITPNEAALTTPSVDCFSRTSVFLSYSHHWQGVEQTHGYVEISNDDGLSWTILVDYENLTRGSLVAPQDTVIDISSYAANESNVKVRFRYTDGGQAGRYWTQMM